MKTLIIIVAVMSSILIISTTALLAADFRCGNTFVEPGMSSTEILLGCGEPKIKEDLGAKRGGDKLAKWVYEKGGVHYVLYFEGGVLTKIEIP